MGFSAKNPQPEEDIVELSCQRTGKSISNWSSYECSSNFFTPTDGWSFTVGNENILKVREAVSVGDRIQIKVNGHIQCTGFVDSVHPRAEVGSGSTWSFEGRDLLAPAVDAGIDPRTQIKPTMTLQDVLEAAISPFFPGSIEFTEDNLANLNVMTGQTKGKKYSKTTTTPRGKQRGGKLLKAYGVDMLKPHMSESAFEFAQRIANRFGLAIWLSADGASVVVGHPRIEAGQETVPFRLSRISSDGSQNNIISGGCDIDMTDQPSCIIADAASGGGTFGRSKTIARIANPLTAYDEDGFLLPEVSALFAKYANATEFVHTSYPKLRNVVDTRVSRPLWLHDEESHTEDQLEGYIRRELSLRLRRAVVGHYRAMGHGQRIDGKFTPWAIDTQVYVQDEQSGVDEMMWLQSRKFHRGAGSSGTYTDLELIRLGSLEF